MMTRSWRQLAEAIGPGMIDLRQFQDRDRRDGRPEQMPGGSGMFSKDDLDDEPHPTMRPPMELPSTIGHRHDDQDGPDPDDSILGIFGIVGHDDDEKDESKFSTLSHKLAKEPGVTNPDALAASIGRKKYGSAGMAAKSAAGRKH